VRNLGVRVERADMRWVGARRKKSTWGFWRGGVLGVGSASHSVNIWAIELILLFTSVDGLFCLGPTETITTSIVETLYSYQKKTITTSTVDTIPLLAPPRSLKHLPLLNVVILLFTDMRAMQRAGPNAIHQIRRQYAGGESPRS